MKFLPEQVFVSRPLAVGLLAAHLLTLGAFFARHLRSRAANIRVWRGTGDLVPEFVCMVLSVPVPVPCNMRHDAGQSELEVQLSFSFLR